MNCNELFGIDFPELVFELSVLLMRFFLKRLGKIFFKAVKNGMALKAL